MVYLFLILDNSLVFFFVQGSSNSKRYGLLWEAPENDVALGEENGDKKDRKPIDEETNGAIKDRLLWLQDYPDLYDQYVEEMEERRKLEELIYELHLQGYSDPKILDILEKLEDDVMLEEEKENEFKKRRFYEQQDWNPSIRNYEKRNDEEELELAEQGLREHEEKMEEDALDEEEEMEDEARLDEEQAMNLMDEMTDLEDLILTLKIHRYSDKEIKQILKEELGIDFGGMDIEVEDDAGDSMKKSDDEEKYGDDEDDEEVDDEDNDEDDEDNDEDDDDDDNDDEEEDDDDEEEEEEEEEEEKGEGDDENDDDDNDDNENDDDDKNNDDDEEDDNDEEEDEFDEDNDKEEAESEKKKADEDDDDDEDSDEDVDEHDDDENEDQFENVDDRAYPFRKRSQEEVKTKKEDKDLDLAHVKNELSYVGDQNENGSEQLFEGSGEDEEKMRQLLTYLRFLVRLSLI